MCLRIIAYKFTCRLREEKQQHSTHPAKTNSYYRDLYTNLLLSVRRAVLWDLPWFCCCFCFLVCFFFSLQEVRRVRRAIFTFLVTKGVRTILVPSLGQKCGYKASVIRGRRGLAGVMFVCVCMYVCVCFCIVRACGDTTLGLSRSWMLISGFAIGIRGAIAERRSSDRGCGDRSEITTSRRFPLVLCYCTSSNIMPFAHSMRKKWALSSFSFFFGLISLTWRSGGKMSAGAQPGGAAGHGTMWRGVKGEYSWSSRTKLSGLEHDSRFFVLWQPNILRIVNCCFY